VSFTGSSWGTGGNNRIWANGGITNGLGNAGLNGYAGNDGQSPDPVFASSDVNQPVIGYSGTCYVTGTPMNLGSSSALPDISFEITGFEQGTAGPGYPNDARPDLIVGDLLTNPRYGAGFPAANLDIAGSLADWGNYCQAVQLAMSLLLDTQQPAARWLEEMTELSVAAVVWSGTLLKIIPYGDQALSANGASWTPNLTWQYSLDDSDFLPWSADGSSGGGSGSTDPVLLTRSDPAQATNWLSIEYLDADNSYNPQIIAAFDQGMIDQYGLRTEPSIQGHEFTNPTSATISAQLMLQRRLYVRNTYQWLEIRAAGADGHRADHRHDARSQRRAGARHPDRRRRKRRADRHRRGNPRGDAVTGTITPIGVGTAVLHPKQATAGAPLDPFVDPGNTNAPIIFEPPAALTGGALEVWIIATGGADWGGCQAWISTDGNHYGLAGTIYRGARQGVLTANLPAAADPDTVDTLAVDLTESQGQLLSGTQADADAYVTLCYCGGELISYETATLTAAYKYGLAYLRRGTYGTAIVAHAAGAPFARFGPNDPSLFRYGYPASFVGQTIYLKLPGFNIFGQALQDLASVTAYNHTLLGTGGMSVDVIASLSTASQSATPC
jgi:hypothetical protein